MDTTTTEIARMRKIRDNAPKRRVTLPSAGLGYRRATPHEFVRFDRVPGAELIGKCPTDGQALIYRCEETGAERRYGIW